MPPVITLTTDFGTRDSYVAELKGVLLSQGPADLRVVDLSHEIAPQDILAGALFLAAAAPRFPRGTIHLAVVDPGVGSARAALAVEVDGHFFVGPDNGLFSLCFDDRPRAVRLEPERVTQAPVSATFHGRDLFAPAAARLAGGLQLYDLGAEVSELVRIQLPRAQARDRALHGEVIHVDHYGNLITNVTADDLATFSSMPRDQLAVQLENHAGIPLQQYYAQVARGRALALVGSSGRLEIAVNQGNASESLRAAVGSAVVVSACSQERA